MAEAKKTILFVRLNDKENELYQKAFEKSGMRQNSEFIRMLVSNYLKNGR